MDRNVLRVIRDLRRTVLDQLEELERLVSENVPQLDLFSQMGIEPLPEIPMLREPEEAVPADPAVPAQAWDGTEVEQERPRRTCRRLANKMSEAKTVRVAEPLGKRKGFYQRMNIEKMVVHRTGVAWEQVREAFNRAVDELKPVCYQGFTSDKVGKLCRFYLKEDRDRLIERTVELLSA